MRPTLIVLLAVSCFGCATKNGPGVARPILPEPVNLIPEPLRLSGSEQYPGQNDLVEKVGTSDLAGRVQILDYSIQTEDPSHAEMVRQIVMNAGVPAENVSVQADPRFQIRGTLNVPQHARVIIRTDAPAYRKGDGEVLAGHNIIAVASAGNVDWVEGHEHDRDWFRSDHPVWEKLKEYGDYDYPSTMRAFRNANGKALLATWADVRTDGSIVPVEKAVMCGDAMEWCFAVRAPPDLLQDARQGGATSSAAPVLGAHTFYLFQLWDTAEEVFGVLKECAIDAGDPGVDREFGLGIPTAVCKTVQDREVQAAGASLSVGRGSAVVSSLLAGPGSSLSLGTDVSLAFSPMEKAPDLFASFSTIAAGKTLQLGRTTLSALTGVGYAPLGVSSRLTRPGHSLFAEAGASREVHSREQFSLSLLAAAGAERGPINTVTARTGAVFKHRSFSLYGGAVFTDARVPIPGHEAVGVPPVSVLGAGWEIALSRSFSFRVW